MYLTLNDCAGYAARHKFVSPGQATFLHTFVLYTWLRIGAHVLLSPILNIGRQRTSGPSTCTVYFLKTVRAIEYRFKYFFLYSKRHVPVNFAFTFNQFQS